MIEKFAGYGFNKSHSTAYALIAYMTAYLKAHYSVEFMAALLSGDMDARNFKKKDSLVEHLEDCRRMNIEVVPPDVNRCEGDFTVADGKILIGLSAIKGCGVAAMDALTAARKAGGPFRDLFDFCERVDPAQINKSTIETLIKAGAFDSLGARRSQLSAVLERAIQSGAALHADRKSGQKGLFDMLEEDAGPAAAVALPDLPEWEDRERLAAEKEVLGFYLSSHPLAEHEKTLATFCSHNTTELANLPHRSEVILGGMISSIKFSQTKNPRPGSTHTRYAMFDLEDMHGAMRCILWPEEFANHGQLVEADATLVVRGAVDRRPGSEEANLVVNELIPLAELPTRFTRGMMVRVNEAQHSARGLEELFEVLRGYPGNCELQLVLCLNDGSRVFMKSDKVRVELNAEMRSRVDALLGPGNVKLVAAPPTPSRPQNGGRGSYGRDNQGRDRAMART
jgi:DNA polymerase III subunit alpha